MGTGETPVVTHSFVLTQVPTTCGRAAQDPATVYIASLADGPSRTNDYRRPCTL